MSPLRALVLGGSGHVGGAVVRALVQRDVRVAFSHHLSSARAEELGRDTGATTFALDLSRPERIREALAALEADGALPDVLVHCAGVPGRASLDAIGDDDWDHAHAVEVRSIFIVCQELARRRTAPWQGVFTAAVDGIQSVSSAPRVAACQAGRMGLTRALAKELGPRGVRINLVTFGVLDGGLAGELPARLRADYLRHSALGRIGRAEEAARLVVWLALENTYMTGAVLAATGGI